MKLTPEQKSAVSAWIASGASISDVQKRLREEFQLSLTYMDTRFVIDDLGLDLKAPPRKPAAPPPSAAAPVAATDANAELIDEGQDYAEGADELADELPTGAAPGTADGVLGGNLSIEIDRVTRPGTVVSGSVKFSDGNTGKWALDQLGRLVFEPAVQGYRPSPADLQAFQRELSTQLQRHGY